jgi:DNA-binding MarR family transcriptional regulator
MAKKMTNADYQALASFRYALRQFERFSEEAAASVGLTPQQHQALLAIRGFPDRRPVLIGDLAERLQIRHHSAVGLVDRLIQQGLVERNRGDIDKRQKFVTLTPKGTQILDQLSSTHREELRRVSSNIDELMKALGKDGQ